jgi:hypothetical protein
MGDPHPALAPGHRLPNSIQVSLATGEECGLHELAHRPGHTVLLLGGVSAAKDELASLAASLAGQIGAPFLEAITLIAIHTDSPVSSLRWTSSAAEQLGVSQITLLVIRPDGHVGLRADRNHVEALSAYCSMLSSREL